MERKKFGPGVGLESRDPAKGAEKRKKLGLDLKVLRILKGETLDDWAIRTNMDKSILSRMERGKYKKTPTRDTLLIMGEALGYQREFDKIMISNGYLPRLSRNLEEFLQDSNNLPIFTHAIEEFLGSEPERGYGDLIIDVIEGKS